MHTHIVVRKLNVSRRVEKVGGVSRKDLPKDIGETRLLLHGCADNAETHHHGEADRLHLTVADNGSMGKTALAEQRKRNCDQVNDARPDYEHMASTMARDSATPGGVLSSRYCCLSM